MNTFLFAWNPKKWEWKDLNKKIERLQKSGVVRERWSCRSHRNVRVGDRAFLIRLGSNPKGIIASGHIATEPVLAPHWNGDGTMVPRVDIDFDTLLDSNHEEILSLDLLKQGILANQAWTPQASGILIKKEIARELEVVWDDFLITAKKRLDALKKNAESIETTFQEGEQYDLVQTLYERNPEARKACLDHYGYSCIVCEFDFEQAYGEIGKHYIHVHHLEKISIKKSIHAVDPIKDLRPVCPNCHAMIHKRSIPFTIEEIRSFRRKGKPKQK